MIPDNSQNKKIRCFIGVTPQIKLRDSLVSYQDCIKPLLSSQRLRWTQPSNLHLTLKFIGNIDDNQLDTLKQQLIIQLKNTKIFKTTMEKIEWFPSASTPRVIALLSSVANIELQALAARCDKAAQQIGVPSNSHPFRGHITLARNRSKIPANNSMEKTVTPLTLQVDRVTIFQSHLTPQGPIYTEQGGIGLRPA